MSVVRRGVFLVKSVLLWTPYVLGVNEFAVIDTLCTGVRYWTP